MRGFLLRVTQTASTERLARSIDRKSRSREHIMRSRERFPLLAAFCAILLLLLSAVPALTAMASEHSQQELDPHHQYLFLDSALFEHFAGPVKVMFDGDELTSDVPPLLIKSRTMIPLRAFFEKIGAEVAFDSGIISVTGVQFELTMTVDSHISILNGNQIMIPSTDPPPTIVRNAMGVERTLIPVRFVAENLGYIVGWDAESGAVEITSPDPEVTHTEHPPERSDPIPKDKIVAIDPGHGGDRWGALGYRDGELILREKDVNLDVSLQLAAILRNEGFTVVMTRTEDITLDPVPSADLHSRPELANQVNADIFISVHNNGAEREGANGTEVFYHRDSPQSIMLAELIQDELLKALNSTDRGVKDGTHYAVIRMARMPAVLTEGLFLSNPDDLDMLMRADVRTAMAVAIANGVLRFFGYTTI